MPTACPAAWGVVEIHKRFLCGKIMPELLKNQVARLLDQLMRFSSPSRRHINRCLTLMRPLLLAAEATEEDVDRFESAVFRALSEGEVLMRLNCAPDVRRTIEQTLASELGLSLAEGSPDWLNSRVSMKTINAASDGKWCLKALDEHTRKSPKRTRRPENFDRRVPSGEDLSSLNPYTMRTPQVPDDMHARDLDREAVERLLRQLGLGGRDFGPEPPLGGSPARL